MLGGTLVIMCILNMWKSYYLFTTYKMVIQILLIGRI